MDDSMIFCRINLSKTNYKKVKNSKIIKNPDIDLLNEIYFSYCRYKKFKSFMPIFDCEYKNHDVIGYFDKDEMVAFSLTATYDKDNAECYQFAWNYKNPKLQLGIKSLKNECAIYKERGFKYLYLGESHEYKEQIKGFEIMGPVSG
jgi:hypothetical protein